MLPSKHISWLQITITVLISRKKCIIQLMICVGFDQQLNWFWHERIGSLHGPENIHIKTCNSVANKSNFQCFRSDRGSSQRHKSLFWQALYTLILLQGILIRSCCGHVSSWQMYPITSFILALTRRESRWAYMSETSPYTIYLWLMNTTKLQAQQKRL